MPTQAELFFEDLRKTRLSAIHKLVAEPKAVETEYLEFKGGRMDDNATKKYWSKSLSAFANTNGGVLVIGIGTKPLAPPEGGRKIMGAETLEPIPNPSQCRQLLKDLLLNATTDVVQKVDYEVINEPDGTGYVCAFIPEGKNKPYRANDGIHYIRAGDNSVMMPQAVLGCRSMFYPRVLPNIELTVENNMLESGGKNHMEYTVRVKNTGTGSAEDLVIDVSCTVPMAQLDGNTEPHPITLPAEREIRAYTQHSLHRGDEIIAFRIRVLWDELFKYDRPTNATFKFAAFCHDTEPAYFRYVVTEERLVHFSLVAVEKVAE